MNEIGELLRSTREESGVSLEEASGDLEIKTLILENIEDGNIGCFKDIFVLKDYIYDYAKYLGLDSEQMVDKFNEFLFDYTSKIPVEAIEEAKKNKKDDKVIVSPYTSFKDKDLGFVKYIVIAIVAILLVVAIYFLVTSLTKGDDFSSNGITYAIGGNVSE